MKEFVDREKELSAFRRCLAKPSSLSLLYGQRRTGKTFLLQHLLQNNRDAVYFLADETTSASLRHRFVHEVDLAGRGGPAWQGAAAADWSAALTLLVHTAATDQRRLVLVIDECQYLFRREPSAPSILQRLWDEYRHKMNLHVILCGSALGTLARLGDTDQPLHGRFDMRLKLKPFACRDAAGFVPGWTHEDKMRLYGAFGGLARHLAEVDPRTSLAKNVIRTVLDPLSPLHEAPLDMLRSERLSSRAEADGVLAAVAAGENQFGLIAARTGLTANRTDYVLKELQALELVRRETRMGDRDRARYARYRCTDPFVTFWFRFVRPNRGALQGTAPGTIWRHRVAPHFDTHMGTVFEEVVRQAFARGAAADNVGPVDEVSSYWSRDGKTQIDLIARAGDSRLMVECKWRARGNVGLDALRQLRDHVSRYPHRTGHSLRLCIATAGGFTSELKQVARLEDVLLLGPDNLLR